MAELAKLPKEPYDEDLIYECQQDAIQDASEEIDSDSVSEE